MMLVIVLSVSDIFFYRINLLPIEPSYFFTPLLVLALFLNKDRFRKVYLHINSLLFFIIVVIISIVYLLFTDYQNALQTSGLILLSFIYYLISVFFFSNINFNQIKNIVLISFAILGFSVVFDMFFSNQIVVRAAGFAENPNSTALRLNLLFILLMYLFQQKRTRNIIIALTIFFITLTLSRSGMITFFLSLFIMVLNDFQIKLDFSIIKKRFAKSILKYVVIIISFNLLLIIATPLIPGFQYSAALDRIEKLKGTNSIVSDGDNSELGRISIAKDYLDLFYDNPLGYGTGMSLNRSFYPFSTHNMLLRFAIDFGVIGLIVLLYFIINGILLGLKKQNVYYVLFFSTVLVVCFFTNTLLENRTFLILVGLLDVLINKFKITSDDKIVKSI